MSPPTVLFTFPAHFAGRNVPDVSFNADPETGYVVDYTSSVTGFGQEHLGGTSFVAPQLNGVTALLGQKAQEKSADSDPESQSGKMENLTSADLLCLNPGNSTSSNAACNSRSARMTR